MWRVLQPANRSHVSKVYVIHSICICLLEILSHSLPGQAMTELKKRKTLPIQSPFSESRGHPTPASALLRGERRQREVGVPRYGGPF